KILATLFFEPSTRTRLSFESAMLRLGGRILGFSTSKQTSAVKGESIADTIRMINNYAHIAVIRHYIEGIGQIANNFATIPFLSGGTGTQEHPTQALLDLYTVYKQFKTIENLTIGVMGDLLYGRTIPSLLFSLAKYENIKINLIAPPALSLRKDIIVRLKEMNCKYSTFENLRDIVDELDVLYVTRIQKERFPDPTDYERLRGIYHVTLEDIKAAKEEMIILHPLPRVDEIDYEVDRLKQAKYFEQAKNGVWVRMALILKYLEVA
ncbi:MAG: aspartate carbamoyltransferase, partial [Candidatus Heimdallarchaeaceae archaeon]